MTAIQGMFNAIFFLTALDGPMFLSAGTITAGFITLILGAVAVFDKKFKADIAVARENSLGETYVAQINKDRDEMRLRLNNLEAGDKRSERWEGEQNLKMTQFQNGIDARLRILENEYIKALTELAKRNPYRGRGNRSMTEEEGE